MLGCAVLLLHTLLALALFVHVHGSRQDAQAGFGWFWFMSLDMPATYVAWEYVAPTSLMRAVVTWGDTWGDGKSLRAFILHAVLGGAQWFLFGWLAGYLLSPKSGLIAQWIGNRPAR
jgi:hypothetical protein